MPLCSGRLAPFSKANWVGAPVAASVLLDSGWLLAPSPHDRHMGCGLSSDDPEHKDKRVGR